MRKLENRIENEDKIIKKDVEKFWDKVKEL
jgi:hypothetical protein